MAVRLPKSVYVHMMKTGGWTVRVALKEMNLDLGEVGRSHDPAGLISAIKDDGLFSFAFVRHPLTWYRSYWSFRMQSRWRVDPRQPISGWQTYGSVLDHECRSNDFEIWMRRVLDYIPEGFLTRIYTLYCDQVDYVGKVESLLDDLARALELAGESFSREALGKARSFNVTHEKFVTKAYYSRELAEKVMQAEQNAVRRWGYDYIPERLIRNGAATKPYFSFLMGALPFGRRREPASRKS